MKKTYRQKLAGKFGRIEHDAGRVIAIPILATIFFIWVENTQWAVYSSITTLFLWIIYLGSHTIEKKLYGPGLRK